MADLPDNTGGALRDLESRYSQRLIELRARFEATGKREGTRRGLALMLKGVAVFGGAVVALGATGMVARAIGVAIALVTVFDSYVSNHSWLMALATARYAWEELREAVEHTLSKEEAKLRATAGMGTPQYDHGMIELYGRLIDWIYNDSRKIKEALKQTDLAALRSLALENRGRAGAGDATA